MLKEKLVVVRGTFNNIYFWGKGYRDLETANAWHNAWNEIKSVFWHHARLDDTEYLVGVQGSIYLHPMDFRTILHSCGCHTSDTYDCADLKRICEEVAEKCGGTFDLEVSEEIAIDANLVPYTDGIHNTLSC